MWFIRILLQNYTFAIYPHGQNTSERVNEHDVMGGKIGHNGVKMVIS